jgi:hypothetical protein
LIGGYIETIHDSPVQYAYLSRCMIDFQTLELFTISKSIPFHGVYRVRQIWLGPSGTNMSRQLQPDTMASDSTIAIPAINAQYSTVNVVGRDQIFITNNYIVDPNCDQGIWINYSNLRLKLMFLPERIYRWLSAVIPSTNYHGALKVRLEDTGLWFINGARFARWKATADDFLWICGTRMYCHHLQIIISSELLWQLALARLF